MKNGETMSDLTCPKDQSPLRTIERNGVTIERCTECGGVFLDRGELERLIDAESRYRGRDEDDDDRDLRYERREPQAHPPQKKKRRGFLEDLLDFG
jgi:Zn-finger nucleic acid-binding protein